MRRVHLVVVLMVVLTWAPTAFADSIWFEVGDATNNMADAQWTVGAGPLTQIVGTMFEAQTGGLTPLVDVYAIYINDPLNFSATTVAPGVDLELFLFNKYGVGIFGNDNISDTNYQARLPGFFGQADIYLLWVSISGRDPGYGLGQGEVQPYPIFPPSGGTGLLYPLAGAGSLAGPTGEARQSYDVPMGYTIDLRPIPEPSSLLLFGTCIGVIGLAMWCRRK